jgi:hypothetical protein
MHTVLGEHHSTSDLFSPVEKKKKLLKILRSEMKKITVEFH